MERPQSIFSIIKMLPSDVEAATRMRLQLWLETYVNDEVGVTREWIETRNHDQLSPEKLAARIEHLNDPNTEGWVAKDREGSVIGVANPIRDTDNRQHVGALYVDKKWHGKGVAAALMQKVIEWSDSTQPIMLEVVLYNERAKAFYRKYGFKEVEESEHTVHELIPVITMIRKGDKQ